MAALHGLSTATMSGRQREGGLRQGDGLFAGNIKFGAPNASGSHQRINSDSSNLKSPIVAKPEMPRSPAKMAAQSVLSNNEEPLVGSNMRDLLDSVARDESDTAFQVHERLSEQHPNTLGSPRMPSPFEPPIPIPPPTSIPPPPVSIKQKFTNLSPARQLREMESRPNEIFVREPQDRSQARGPTQHSELSLQQQNAALDSTFDFEFEEIQKSRLENWSLLSKIHQMRYRLREKQMMKSTADDKLLQRLSREKFGLSSSIGLISWNDKSIEELMRDCQEARAEYGPLEDDCNRLEDQLSEQEFELSRMEEHFYKRWKTRPSHTPPVIAAFQQPSPTPSMTFDVEEVPRDHPLLAEFQSRMGDLDILQEQLIDVEEERVSLEGERTSRQRFGRSLAPEDQTWLNDSQALFDELLKKIRATEEDVNRIRNECFSLGLINEDGEPTDLRSQERRTFQDEEDMNANDQPSEYVKHPMLLPKPGVKPSLSEDSVTEPDEISDSLGRRINQWILGQLRESALEVNLLERTFVKDYGDVDERWEGAVLAVWWDDGTANTEGRHVYTSSMTTQAPILSHHSSTSSNFNPKLYSNESYRFIVAHRLRLPPSTHRSDGTEKEILSAKSLSFPKASVHWNIE